MSKEILEISKEINRIFRAMNMICNENSKLLAVTRDKFISQGFKPCRGSSVMWDTSTSYNNPNYWLPYFQQMVFYKEKDPCRAIGVNFLLYDIDLNNSISFISCGLIVSDQKLSYDHFNLFYSAGWDTDDSLSISIFEQTKAIYETASIDNNSRVYNYFLPFDIINGPEKVDTLIIHPLLSMYNRKMSDADLLIFNFALKTEELT